MRRKSTAEKKAVGTYRPSRDKRSPQFMSANVFKAPSYVKTNKLAYAEWKAVVPFLEAEGILKQPDISLLASYCILYARWRSAVQGIETQGQVITVISTTRTGRTERPAINPLVRAEVLYQAAMMKCAIKFGLNPLDRPRVEASPFDKDEDDDSSDDDFMNVPIQ